MATSRTKTPLKALIFDVDGTLADTEDAHRAAFNQAFADAGLGWVWDETLYIDLLDVTGGKERILHYWNRLQPGPEGASPIRPSDWIDRLHASKTTVYCRMVQDGSVQLRPGVLQLLRTAHRQGIPCAIATTTTRANVDALLLATLGPAWQQYFAVIEDASTAPLKKPHPQVYLQAMERLGLPAHACLAFEDSANGLAAARGAGLATVVTPNRYTQHHIFTGALRELPSLQDCALADLQVWHAGKAVLA